CANGRTTAIMASGRISMATLLLFVASSVSCLSFFVYRMDKVQQKTQHLQCYIKPRANGAIGML
ncbi:MAG: hypothetical protein M3R61_08650, partial [Chloroflexota bacterium]|nr:hypothetical protein [Chloroflexota bacterium]